MNNCNKINIYIFVFNFCIYSFVGFYFYYFIIDDKLYLDLIIETTNTNDIEYILDINRKFSWISILLNPFVYLIKLLLITSSLYTIKIIYKFESGVSFSILFSKVLIADTIYTLFLLIKLVYFILFRPDNIFQIQNFAPGSLYQLVSQVNEPWLVYPLQAISIWEIGFIVVLAYQLKEFFQNDFALSLQNVLLSYGTVFLLWIVFVVFITLNLS